MLLGYQDTILYTESEKLLGGKTGRFCFAKATETAKMTLMGKGIALKTKLRKTANFYGKNQFYDFDKLKNR